MMGWYWGGRWGRGVQWVYWIFQTDYVDEGWACDAALSLYDAVASIPAAVSTPANYKVNRSRWIVWVGSKVAYEREVGLFGSWVGLGGHNVWGLAPPKEPSALLPVPHELGLLLI